MSMKKMVALALVAVLTLGDVLPSAVTVTKAKEKAVTDYIIYPVPHMETYAGGNVTVPQEVKVRYSSGVDEVSKDYLEETISSFNGTTVSETSNSSFEILASLSTDEDKSVDYTPQTEQLYEKNDAYTLVVDENQISIVGNDNDALFAGISTLSIMLEQSENQEVLKTTIEDYADVQYRGVVEGYYGIPWSNENVISYMEWGSKYKLNTFIYAPKDDPYHNSRWREPYPETELAKMQEMIEAGTRTKLRFVYAIHPFMSNGINKENFAAELKHITDKFEMLYNLGVRQFALLADDASSETALQVKTINALTEWLNSKEGTYPLIFCPQAYSGTPNANYFAQFKNGTTITIGGVEETVPAVDEKVEIMYTGSAIIGNVESSVAQTFHNVSGRNPYFWLNWPVNDYTDSTLFIGKAEMLKSRDNNLNGLVANPMCEAQLSKIGLFQVADYAWNVADFDMDASWKASFANVDKDAAQALSEVAKHMSYPRDGVYHQTGLAWEESEELVPYINALKAKIEAGENAIEEATELKEQLQIIKTAAAEVKEKSKNQNLVEEFEPYKTSLDATLNASITGMDALIAYYNGNYDETWSLYSQIGQFIKASDAVTKPGLKPGGDVQLEVKPSTKYLRPLAKYLNQKVAGLMNEILQGDTVTEAKPYYHFTEWTGDKTAEMNKYLDGNDSTFAALEYGGTQQAGDYFGVDLGSVQNVTHIRVLQGSSDTDHDIFHQCVVEVSENGTDWKTIDDFTGGTVAHLYDQDVNVKGRYVRMRLKTRGYNGKPDYWLHVRDFTVTANAGPAILSDIEDLSSVQLVVTDEKAVLTLTNTAVNVGQFVGVDLKKIQKLHITSDLLDDYDILASKNGKEWEKVNGEEDAIARYVRLINHTDASVTATGSVQMAFDVVESASVQYGSVHGEADGYNATVQDNPAQEIFRITGLTEGRHTIVIQSKGDRGTDKVSLDRFEITNGTVEQVNLTTSTPGLRLSTNTTGKSWAMWSPKANWLNSDEIYLVDANGLMEYTFEGTEIALFGAKGPSMGELEYFIDGAAFDGSGDNIFDRKDNTLAHYKTNQVTVNLGQTIQLNSVQLKFGEESLNQNPEYVLGQGKLEVSKDGNTWTAIHDFNIQSVSDLTHEAPYYFMTVDCDVQAKYIRLALNDMKEFTVNEMIVNDGEGFAGNRDYALTTTAPETARNPVSNLTDGDLSTGFEVNDAKDGYIRYDLSEEAGISSITVVQDAATISNAKVEILSCGEWKEIGTLSHAINLFDVSDYANITAVRVAYPAGSQFKLMEFIYKTDVDLQPADYSAVDAAIAKAEKLVEDQYTADTWSALQDAVKAVVKGYNNTKQDAVNAMADAIETAITGLALESSGETVKTTFTVTVDGTVKGDAYKYNAPVTITETDAKPVEGKVFAGWEVDGKLVSVESSYKFYVSNDVEITSRFVEAEETVEEKPEALLTSVSVTKRADGKSDMRFVGQLVIPDGYELVNAGLIWSTKDASVLELGSGLKPTYIKAISDTNQFSVTIKGVPNTLFLRGRIFATIREKGAAEGSTQVIYSVEKKAFPVNYVK